MQQEFDYSGIVFKKFTNYKLNEKKDISFLKKSLYAFSYLYLNIVNIITFLKKIPIPYFQKMDIERIAFNFLKKNELSKFSELLKNGYKIPLIQEHIYKSKIMSLTDNMQQLDTLLKNGLLLTPSIIHALFFNSHFQIYCHSFLLNYAELKQPPTFQDQRSLYLDKEHYISSLKIVCSYLQDKKNELALFQEWLSFIQSTNRLNIKHSILEPYQYFEKTIVKNLSSIQKQKLYHILDKVHKKLSHNSSSIYDKEYAILASKINNLVKNTKNDSSQKMEHLINRTRTVYLNEKIETLPTEQYQKNTLNIQTRNLPEESKQIVHNIETLYKNILMSNSIIESDVKNNMERFVLQRLPEFLSNYLSLDHDFKETMLNKNGENATEILNKSLDNIKKYLEQIYNNINEQKFSSLNAGHKYTEQYISNES